MNSLACTPSLQLGGFFSLTTLDDRPGLLVFRATGPEAEKVFENEAGGHRWQRIPPNEKRGRVHTSTVTVAILPEPSDVQVKVLDQDIEWTAIRGSGAGGQARNKTSNCVQMRHIPTKIMVRCESERSQSQNRQEALALLRARLWQAEKEKTFGDRDEMRKKQLGSGMRGDKRRTIRMQDGVVTDHVLDKRWRLKDYLRGDW